MGKKTNHPWFPLFVSLKYKKIVVFGGGNIAARRIMTLLQFDADITIIAPDLVSELQGELAVNGKLTVYRRKYSEGDCQGAYMVLAATNDRDVNLKIADECTKYGIPVSVADCKERCTFYFPAVVKRGNLVIGLTASGDDHAKVRKTADKLQRCIDELLE